jgi:Flp pilus assembly protein TadG
MTLGSLRSRLHRAWTSFPRAASGNVSVTFTIALLPVVALTGGVVDYSKANQIKARMQSAVDSTALTLSKSAPTVSSSELQQSATSQFTALFTAPHAKNVSVTPTYDSSTSTLTVAGSATMNTDFLGVLGMKELKIAATSTVVWGSTKLRVALALDNTGSMSYYNKLPALKTASRQLLTQLQGAAKTPGDVRVAIIPFSTDVNIGTAAASNWWIDWSNWAATGSIENGMTCRTDGGGGRRGNGRGWGGWGGGGGTICGSSDHSAWNGCIMDRVQDYDYDVKNTAPIQGLEDSYFPADQSDWCPQQLMPLSYDWTALNAKIDAMTASGNTNQVIGLVWAWHALTSTSPLNAPALTDNATSQVIILFTDGLNTETRWSTSQSEIDARTRAVCQNIKAAGITVYTILVMAGSSQVLKDCASSPDKYYALTQAGDIVTTFNQIGTALSQLRIAK